MLFRSAEHITFKNKCTAPKEFGRTMLETTQRRQRLMKIQFLLADHVIFLILSDFECFSPLIRISNDRNYFSIIKHLIICTYICSLIKLYSSLSNGCSYIGQRREPMAAYVVLLRLIIVMAYVLIFPLHPRVGKKANV